MLSKLRTHWQALNSSPVVRQVKERRLTYLGYDALTDLERAVRRIESSNVPGIIVEAGCALGGSAVILGSAKRRERPLRLYDVFGMIPPPSQADGEAIQARYHTIVQGKSEGIGGDRYYGYQADLLQEVITTLRSFGLDLEGDRIALVRGLFQDTMHIDESVALAHIDADWYESVRTCLQRVVPHLSSGGTLVIDDYEHWDGCRRAVDDYFADKRNEYSFHRRSRLQIVREMARG
ncbi:MAG TPA: TylF/MycF/NovP-related O-methyltransferase [Gemmatimonadales bacterium]|nr:TylF/MycF/NovP-related O-methyltransferase [Gemmatimonadales bacterium]